MKKEVKQIGFFRTTLVVGLVMLSMSVSADNLIKKFLVDNGIGTMMELMISNLPDFGIEEDVDANVIVTKEDGILPFITSNSMALNNLRTPYLTVGGYSSMVYGMALADLFAFEEEEELAIEEWMTDSDYFKNTVEEEVHYFNIDNNMFEYEVEDPLQVEEWMVNEHYWN
ncbi:hypothetical protein EYV94_17665 [Puteibacter caeruleilacunae]|nr:hypothetical protein EYV94_17665 [Puteibacter caeruleilacunae]